MNHVSASRTNGNGPTQDFLYLTETTYGERNSNVEILCSGVKNLFNVNLKLISSRLQIITFS